MRSGHQVSSFVPRISNIKRMQARRYKGYFVSGYRFRVENEDSEVMQTATSRCYSSSRDQNPTEENIDCYEILTDVVQITYGDDDTTFGQFKCNSNILF